MILHVAECFICTKQASGDALGCGVIYEDDLVFASHIPPAADRAAYLGHVFVERDDTSPGSVS